MLRRLLLACKSFREKLHLLLTRGRTLSFGFNPHPLPVSFDGLHSFISGKALLTLIVDDWSEAVLLLLEPSRAVFEVALHPLLPVCNARLLELLPVVRLFLLFLPHSRFEHRSAAGAKFRCEVLPFLAMLETAVSSLLANVGGGTSNEIEALATGEVPRIRVQALRHHDDFSWFAFARALPLSLPTLGLLCRSLAAVLKSFIKHVVERGVEELPLRFHIYVFAKSRTELCHMMRS